MDYSSRFFQANTVTNCVTDTPIHFRYSSSEACISIDGQSSTNYFCDTEGELYLEIFSELSAMN